APEGIRLEASSIPWSYSASLRPALAGQSGRAIIDVHLQADRGQIGVLILERGSSVLMVSPEQSVVAGDPATLRFEIPAIEEVGDLVFRGWPHADGAAVARIFAITLS